jgi:hypothetical protein
VKKGGDRPAVELRAGLLGEDVQCLLVCARWSVSAAGGDGIEGVSHGDDPGAERDVGADEAIGIAVAIESLVVMTDHGCDLGVSDGCQHVRTVHGMTLYDCEFRVAEAPRVVENLSWRTELTHVVHRGRRANPGDLGRR